MKPPFRWKSWGLAFFRALVLVAIFACFHRAASRGRAAFRDTGSAISLTETLRYFPTAVSLSQETNSPWQTVLAEDGSVLGSIIQTAPQSDSIIGFSGSSNTLVAFDADGKVKAMHILDSGDTEDHVEQVLNDQRFMTSLHGKSWEDLSRLTDIEAVSGATLTSQAVIEGVIRRTGGSVPSLRFPIGISLAEAKAYFPRATRLESLANGLQAAYSSTGEPLGYLARTSPHSDSIIGYQGPTDTLIAFNPDKRVIGIKLRESFDNTDYVESIAIDDYFLSSFNEQTLTSLPSLDLIEAGIEGVSGATMTSMAMADGVQTLSKHLTERPTTPSPPWWRWVSLHQFGTIAITLFGIIMAMSGLRGVRWVRLTFQGLLIGYLGFHNGHFVSQALLAGWASHGIPWQLAPGLVFLTAAAFIIPLFSGNQVYCHQLCPHGAAQQWLKGRAPWKWRVPRALDRVLCCLPVVLLGITVIATVRAWPLNLAAIEAFDAYLFPIVGLSALLIAVGGLALSSVVPMAYCRYGCPTGAVLSFVRRRGPHDSFQRRDVIAVGLLAAAFFLT